MSLLGKLVLIISGSLLLAGAIPGATVAEEPVPFKKLLPIIAITLPGWQQDGQPTGATVKDQGIVFTEVEARYKKGEQSLQIKILDNPTVSLGFLGLGYTPGFIMESAEESMQGTKIFGYPAMETMRLQDKEAKIEMLAANRFLVVVEGQGFQTMQELKDVLANFDIPKLAELAK